MNTFARSLAVAALALSVQAGLSAQAAEPAKPAAVTAIARTASYITTAMACSCTTRTGARRTARS